MSGDCFLDDGVAIVYVVDIRFIFHSEKYGHSQYIYKTPFFCEANFYVLWVSSDELQFGHRYQTKIKLYDGNGDIDSQIFESLHCLIDSYSAQEPSAIRSTGPIYEYTDLVICLSSDLYRSEVLI